MLTVLYFQTRRLWLPIALHLSWNFAQSWLWGFDVSGIKIEGQFFVVTQHASDLVTGGEFGLEGSILATVLFAAIIVWFLVKPIIRPTAEVAALWASYPGGFGIPPTHQSDSGFSILDARSTHRPGFEHEESSSIENREPSIENRESSI
jgi:hypothetical protein